MNTKQLDAKIRKDFRAFLTLLWQELGLPRPSRAQLGIAAYLQHGPKRLQIQAFRGVGKSWITSAFVLWTLYRDPDVKILVVSASKERADNFSIFCQKLISDISFLNHLAPRSDDQRWSRISFDVGPAKPHQAPSCKSGGITSSLTGSRADLLVFDDIEVPLNAATDAQRSKLLQLCTEAESILTPDDNSRILFLGTPQSSFSVYNTLSARGYRPYVWPARYPESADPYAGNLAPELVSDLERGVETGTPTDTRFTDFDLNEREAAMGRSNFQLQFQLNTTLSDAEKFPLKFADLIVTPLGNECAERYVWSSDPRYVIGDLNPVGLPGDRFHRPMFIDEAAIPYAETIVACDPAGKGQDECVATVLSQANGYIFLRRMKAYRDGYSDETLSDIVRLCKNYKATTLLVEENFGDGMILELFKRHVTQQSASVALEGVRVTSRKEERIIDTLEPILNQHKLIVDPRVWEWDYASNPKEPPEKRIQYMLGTQLSRMTREVGAVRHDDRADCLALGCRYYIDALAQSAFKSQALRRNQEWQAMMDAFDNDPQAATDILVTGGTFNTAKITPNRVYDWVDRVR